jgi:hypothetical protein
MSSSANGERRRVGQSSKYLFGGENTLVRRPRHPGENLEQVGAWSREQLVRMDDCFVVAVEAAFRSGLESPASASAVERLPLAKIRPG